MTRLTRHDATMRRCVWVASHAMSGRLVYLYPKAEGKVTVQLQNGRYIRVPEDDVELMAEVP